MHVLDSAAACVCTLAGPEPILGSALSEFPNLNLHRLHLDTEYVLSTVYGVDSIWSGLKADVYSVGSHTAFASIAVGPM